MRNTEKSARALDTNLSFFPLCLIMVLTMGLAACGDDTSNSTGPVCGDGTLAEVEECDDGNTEDGDGCSATCTAETVGNTCGDGTQDAGEECDDGNNAGGDGCSATCTTETAGDVCGDGTQDAGEECDDGNTTAGDGCSATCTTEAAGGVCGDGTQDAGEECDDGNTTAGDGCSATCTTEMMAGVCGDGNTDAGEACDDGNTVDGDGCSADCLSDETCGNAIADLAAGEECDDGNATDGDGCSAACLIEGAAACGDGAVDAGEVCDDGNVVDADGCSADCLSDESCGNSIIDAAVGESCDDGNATAGDGCDDSCQVEGGVCGDGTLNAGEACDDGNVVDADGCAADCSSDESCGNDIIDTAVGETCDDGNIATGDGCDSLCQIEVSASCGDGTVDAGEVCDDGNIVDGDGCSGNCLSNEACGNDIIDGAAGEVCDDGNTADGDGCSATCDSDETCGNSVIDVAVGEECDDGGVTPGDGCDAACLSEVVIACGNGTIDAGEQCDDGNTLNEDGCDDACSFEFCGDGVVQTSSNEQCDDGNFATGDGCSVTCVFEGCGNGVVDEGVGESCDDGNATNGDGCDDTCQLECTDDLNEDDDDTTNANVVAAVPATFNSVLCGDDISATFGIASDWYEVTIGANERISAVISDGATTACVDQDLFIQVYDSTITLVAGSGSSQWICPEVVTGDLAAGTYYVLVWNDPAPAVQDYTLTIDTGLATCGNSMVELGEQCDDATPACNAATCQLSCTDDAQEDNDDFEFPFDATASGNTTFNGVLCEDDVSPAFNFVFDNHLITLSPGERFEATIGDGATTSCVAQSLTLGGFVFDPANPNGTIQLVDADSSDGVDCPEMLLVYEPTDPNAPDVDVIISVWTDLGVSEQDYTLSIASELNVICGDGAVGLGEDCDDSNTVDGDGCSAFCTDEVCGNGSLTPGSGEWCDDGNTTPGDGCDGTCQLETPPPPPAFVQGDFGLCVDDGPRAAGVSGTLMCTTITGAADFVWDWYTVDVQAGDCVDIHVDNSATGAADLIAFAVDPNQTTTYGLDLTNFSQLEDEWACSTTPWNNFGCPSQGLAPLNDGQLLVLVAQWDDGAGGGCINGAGYTLFTAVNGAEVTPVLIQDDATF